MLFFPINCNQLTTEDIWLKKIVINIMQFFNFLFMFWLLSFEC